MSRLNALRASPFFGIEIGIAARPLDFLLPEWLAEDPWYSSEERLGQILCSAVVYGALLDRTAWQSWLDEVDRMQCSDGLAWISYELKCDQSPTEYRSRRWFADPITHRLLDRRLRWLRTDPRLDAEQCLLAFLNCINFRSPVTASAVDDLEQWAIMHWRLRMPALLNDQAVGNCETTAICERSFLRLTEGRAAAAEYSPPVRPNRPWREKPLSDHNAAAGWYADYTANNPREVKVFVHARKLHQNNEYSLRQIKGICASWLRQAQASFNEEPARQDILSWCIALLRLRRPYGPQGYALYTVEQKLAILLEGVFQGNYPVTLMDIDRLQVLSRAKVAVTNEQDPTRRRLVASVALDFVGFMDDRSAWAERKSGQRLSRTGLDAVEAEIISDDEYGRCLSYAYKMDPSGELALMIILGFRAGLRMKEVAGLETSDFVSSDKHHELHLQSNHYRNLKTPDSRRILPLDVLLTSRELVLLEKWLAPRRKYARKIKRPILCFGPLGSEIMPSAKYLTHRIDKILKAITGQDLTYHCLRHSFSSYLMMKLLLPDPESELLIPRSFRNNVTWDHSRILHNRLIGRGSLGQSAMHAVSMLMGHTGIPRTLKSYQHLLDLAVYLYCSRSAAQVPLCDYIRDHLDEDPDEPRLASPELIDPTFLKKALREMTPLHKSSGDLLPLNKNAQFQEQKGYWPKSGRAPWMAKESRPLRKHSVNWKLVHELVTLPPFKATELALQSRLSSDWVNQWRKSHHFLVCDTKTKTRPQTLYLPRGAIANEVVDKIWRRKAKVSTEQDLSLLREFLDGYRTNDGACRFSTEERAKDFASLLRKLGIPGEHIGIAFGSRDDLRKCQRDPGEMALFPLAPPFQYREAKAKPVRRRQAEKRPALWISYIKLEEDELGWSFSRQHRLDALNDLRDEEILASGEPLSKRRSAAKAKRVERAEKIKTLNKRGKAVYMPGSSAYLFGLQMLGIYHGITKDDPPMAARKTTKEAIRGSK